MLKLWSICNACLLWIFSHPLRKSQKSCHHHWILQPQMPSQHHSQGAMRMLSHVAFSFTSCDWGGTCRSGLGSWRFWPIHHTVVGVLGILASLFSPVFIPHNDCIKLFVWEISKPLNEIYLHFTNYKYGVIFLGWCIQINH